MQDLNITLAHGNGGRLMRELIEEVFARHLGNPYLDTDADAVALPLNSAEAEIVITTDGFTVQPLEYPGGSIGSLAVHGTANDLAVAGATPKYFTLNVFIEEGLELELLERVLADMAAAANALQVLIVAGDTKVVRRGEGGGLYLATTGVGTRQPGTRLGIDRIICGDEVLVSGPIGDHGIAVMLAREQFGLRGELRSDEASVLPLTQAVLQLPGLRFMRDATRGGLATVAHEIAHGTGATVRLRQADIPVRDRVQSVCKMLGYDPYYLACEGRVVAVTSPDDAEQALNFWKSLPEGNHAARIGAVQRGPARVVLETELGGERFLEELEDDPLPRIC
jgi:hydrogenase expression/formation protein HypE